jgi:hypothetical protein
MPPTPTLQRLFNACNARNGADAADISTREEDVRQLAQQLGAHPGTDQRTGQPEWSLNCPHCRNVVYFDAVGRVYTRGKSPSCGAASELANLMAEWLP